MAVISCPNCQGKLRFPDDSPPRRVKCPACAQSFMAGPQGPITGDETATATGKTSEAEPVSSPAKPKDADDFEVVDEGKPSRTSRRDDDDDDDRDRKRKRDDDDDDRPRSKRR